MKVINVINWNCFYPKSVQLHKFEKLNVTLSMESDEVFSANLIGSESNICLIIPK